MQTVLDHGYVSHVEHWGSDQRIIEAARMSTDKGFEGWGPNCPNAPRGEEAAHDLRSALFHPDPDAVKCSRCGTVVPKAGDEKLLKFLWDHKHHTPFEMAGCTIEVQAPIFVFREWHRHRTQSYNEMSARYTPLPDVNYIPSVERLMVNAGGTNRQAGTVSGSKELTRERAERFREQLADVYAHDQKMYESALQDGVPKELARIHLPVGRYSRMRASANLRNWLGFLALRDENHAQWEIREYAKYVRVMLQFIFPRTLQLFNESRET